MDFYDEWSGSSRNYNCSLNGAHAVLYKEKTNITKNKPNISILFDLHYKNSSFKILTRLT